MRPKIRRAKPDRYCLQRLGAPPRRFTVAGGVPDAFVGVPTVEGIAADGPLALGAGYRAALAGAERCPVTRRTRGLRGLRAVAARRRLCIAGCARCRRRSSG